MGYINTITEKKSGRPLILAMSADLSDSTNISGFAKGYGEANDKGFYEKSTKNILVEILDSFIKNNDLTSFLNNLRAPNLLNLQASVETISVPLFLLY